jgi:predicted RNA-binding Zn ribbon-like protein
VELTDYAQLAVHLVNTVNPDQPGSDVLTGIDEVLVLVGDHRRWAQHTTLRDVEVLRRVRGCLREVFERAATGDGTGAVAVLNMLLDESVVSPQITAHDGTAWHLHLTSDSRAPGPAHAATAVMGLAAALTALGVDRFGVCRAAGCRDVFLDTSSNRTRRYCSPRCATRANVTAYRARARGGQ